MTEHEHDHTVSVGWRGNSSLKHDHTGCVICEVRLSRAVLLIGTLWVTIAAVGFVLGHWLAGSGR
jgi:hypothetical protein